MLTCDVSGDPEPSVTWSKDGNANIPRAQFKNNSRILVIEDVRSVDSGVYECKASNKFGESHSATAVIVTPGTFHWLQRKSHFKKYLCTRLTLRFRRMAILKPLKVVT